ncbi:AAA family ATPase [Pelotomaculum propionicicum]|uniref:AAA+ ATPase domain-containing protein n=1 Tax=Pelotomaculum propionicicum TaxID=258475 RepID=A0A4Y7RMX7_9FIRM|nr:AAA family ATPase [Pelotomaculum propionicicum]TEB10022.1 hypothetical protein Pmgp_02717 [Pelotomaculum propionicicum]
MSGAAEVLDFQVNDTNKDEQELRLWLTNQVKEQGVMISFLAREIGYSHSMLSQFIAGNKCSKNLLKKIRRLKEKADQASGGDILQRADLPVSLDGISDSDKPFKDLIETDDLASVLGLCSLCRADGEIGVITGAPGTGKTTALEEFRGREPFTVYIRADVTMSGRELVKELGDKLGVDIQEGTQRSKIKQIIKHLRDDPVLVIVDEADLLVSRDSVKKLEILRTIWDEAHCGLILAGLPRLATFLVKGPGGRENLSQFYSRVRRAYAMKGVKRSEILPALAGYNMTDAARNYLVTAATSKAQGGLRRYHRLLQNALDLVEQGETITLEVVQEADSMLVSPKTLGLAF